MPSWKSTLILFVIAVICVAAAAYTWRSDALSATGSEVRFALFEPGALPVDALERIELARRDAPAMVFQRHGTAWKQIEPFEYPMETFSVRRFGVEASALEAVDTIDPRETPADLGLDPPLAKLTFEWEGAQRTLEFGRRTVGGRGYLRLDDDATVYVVDKTLHDRVLDMEPKEWRSRNLFQHAGLDSNHIKFESPDGIFMLERERRRWRLLEPHQTRVLLERTEEYLARLGAAKLDSFILDQPDDLAQFGLTEPFGRFTVVTGAASAGDVTETIIIGAPHGARGEMFYAMREGVDVVFAISTESFAEMMNIAPLIDPTASGVRPEDVFSIRISGRDREFTLSRDETNPQAWRSPDFDDAPADAAAVNQLLETLTQTASSGIEPGPFDHERMEATITFFGIDSRAIDTVRISRDPAGQWWQFDNGDELQRQFPISIALPIVPAAFGLR